ncbi:MAG: sugar nucleotide-binding protein [Candidatus Microthrix sp.]|nr:sugar nucleotide-binding protein [Candidatus Microthrix sp.]
MAAAGHEVVATDINLTDRHPWGPAGPELGYLDVRDRHAIRDAFDAVRPDFVTHLAAETSLEFSDADPAHAYLTNATATKLIAQQCGRREIPIVYISTAGVFDGTKTGPYTEFDAPNPINTYGDSKWRGEREVRQFAMPLHRAGRVDGGWRRRQGPQVRVSHRRSAARGPYHAARRRRQAGHPHLHRRLRRVPA